MVRVSEQQMIGAVSHVGGILMLVYCRTLFLQSSRDIISLTRRDVPGTVQSSPKNVNIRFPSAVLRW